MSEYYFGEDREAEEQRLDAVEAYSDPGSRAVLRELGVGAGWTCWEVGAGRGSIAYWLADLVGPDGRVMATDIDTHSLQNHPNLEIARHDIVRDALPQAGFDLIHARFLLEHVPRPDRVLRRLTSALRPGGLLVVEDTDGLDLLVDPDIGDIAQVCSAWERAASSISWNPRFGRQLVSGLTGCGLDRVQGVSYRRKGPGGRNWAAVKLGLIRLHDGIVDVGASKEAVSRLFRALDDPDYTITGADTVIAWGARAR